MGRGGGKELETNPLSEVQQLQCELVKIKNELDCYKTLASNVAIYMKDQDWLGSLKFKEKDGAVKLETTLTVGHLPYLSNLIHGVMYRLKNK